jgi:hypothetical protein
MKNLIINSLSDKMIIEPLDTFKCVHFSLKDNNLNEWNDFILDINDIQKIVKFLTLQIKKSKTKKDFNKQRFNNV